jgi:hypothetical protein
MTTKLDRRKVIAGLVATVLGPQAWAPADQRWPGRYEAEAGERDGALEGAVGQSLLAQRPANANE